MLFVGGKYNTLVYFGSKYSEVTNAFFGATILPLIMQAAEKINQVAEIHKSQLEKIREEESKSIVFHSSRKLSNIATQAQLRESRKLLGEHVVNVIEKKPHSLDNVITSYKAACKILRENNETLLLMQALNELGDIWFAHRVSNSQQLIFSASKTRCCDLGRCSRLYL